MPILVVGSSVTGTDDVAAPDAIDISVTLRQGVHSLELSGPWTPLDGAQGLDDAVVELSTTSSAAVYGEYATGLAIRSREVFLPVYLRAGSGSAWRTARDDLRAVANPLNGPTTIVVSTADGRSRSIEGYRVIEQTTWDTGTWSVHGWQRLGLLFRCPRPWWIGDRPADLGPWRTETTTGFLSTTFLPVVVGESSVFGASVSVDVSGDVGTWPTWTIDGSADEVTVVHENSGRTWTLDTTGLVRPITVTTDPAAASVLDGDGVRRWSSLAAPFDLWPLPIGANTVRVDIVGADATTVVSASADSLYLAAL